MEAGDMTPGDLLQALEAQGIRVTADRGRLQFSVPEASLAPLLRREIERQRAQVLAEVLIRAQAEASDDPDADARAEWLALPVTLRGKLYARFPDDHPVVCARFYSRLAELTALLWPPARAEARACWDTQEHLEHGRR